MRTQLLAITAAAICAATGASAEGFGHKGTDITIGYDSWDVSAFFSPTSESGSTRIARVRTDWALGANLGVQVNLDHASFSFAGGSNAAVRTLALHPYWEMGATGRAGAFYQTTSYEYGSGSIDYMGVEGMFTLAPGIEMEMYAGKGDIDDAPLDIKVYGVTLHYAMNGRFGMHMAYDHETLDFGGGGFNNSRFNVGVDYHMAAVGNMPPVIFTAEAGTVDMMGIYDLTVIGAKVTIPLGGTSGSSGRKLFRERGVFWAAGGIGGI